MGGSLQYRPQPGYHSDTVPMSLSIADPSSNSSFEAIVAPWKPGQSFHSTWNQLSLQRAPQPQESDTSDQNSADGCCRAISLNNDTPFHLLPNSCHHSMYAQNSSEWGDLFSQTGIAGWRSASKNHLPGRITLHTWLRCPASTACPSFSPMIYHLLYFLQLLFSSILADSITIPRRLIWVMEPSVFLGATLKPTSSHTHKTVSRLIWHSRDCRGSTSEKSSR